MKKSYVGKYASSEQPRGRRKLRKPFIVLLSLLLVLGMGIGATVAYVFNKTAKVENQFTPGEVGCVVNENYTVSLTPATNTSAYVRIALVAYWEDNATKKVYAADVSGVEMNMTGDWRAHGGYYYYPEALIPGANSSTPAFTTGFTYTGDVPEGCTLHVDVVADAIQATGQTDNNAIPSYLDAWDN